MQTEVDTELHFETLVSPDHPSRLSVKHVQAMSKVNPNKLKVRFHSDTYRGVHAAKSLSAGEILMMVPVENMITS